MSGAGLSAERRKDWQRLEHLITRAEGLSKPPLKGDDVTALCRLHRACCRDLSQAMARSEPDDVQAYLQGLAGRGHAVLYRLEGLPFRDWRAALFSVVPARLYRDPCLWISAGAFFGMGLLSFVLALVDPSWTDVVLGSETKENLDHMYSLVGEGRAADENAMMAGFYVRNNVGIAIRTFAYGIFLGLGSLVSLLANGLFIGATFGYMIEGPYRMNFLSFVTAHAPFELFAITVAGAAGLRIGFSVVRTRGLTRLASLQRETRESVPALVTACLLLLAAALIEGFFSPLPLHVTLKLPVFLLSLTVLFTYFVVLGSRGARRAPEVRP